METETQPKTKLMGVAIFDKLNSGLAKMREDYKDVPEVEDNKEGLAIVKATVKVYRDTTKQVEEMRLSEGRLLDAQKKKLKLKAEEIQKVVDEVFEPHKKALDDEKKRVADIALAKKEAKEKHVAEVQARMDGMKDIFIKAVGKKSSEIAIITEGLKAVEITEETFGDFEPEAKATKDALLGKLKALHESAKMTEESEEKIKVAEAELAQKQEVQRILDEKREEEQRLEDELRAAEKEEADKVERERVEKENEDLREKNRVLEAKQKELDDKQAAIDKKEREQKEEADRLEEEKAAAREKLISSIKAFDNFRDEAKDCDTSEQCEAIVQAVRDINLDEYGELKSDAIDKQNEVLAFVVAIHGDNVKAERQEKRAQEIRDAEDKERQEKVTAAYEREKEQRLTKLIESLSPFIEERVACEALIDSIQNNEIPYISIDFTKE